MASQCPKCGQPVDEDYVCCAGVEFQWKCLSCQKRNRGFALPFGRCALCGGELVRVDDKGPSDDAGGSALREAFEIEISAFHFYRRLAEAVDDPETSDFFKELSEMEREHATELQEKYHLHLDNEEIFRDTGHPLPQPFFEDLRFFADTGDIRRLYESAIALEKKTLDFFTKKAQELSGMKVKELYLELAAEERNHISLLESERDK